MYNYLIIPTTSGFTLQIGTNKLKTIYKTKKRIEAIRIVELIGLNLRPIDQRQSVSTLDNSFLNNVDISDSADNLDSETTYTVPIFDLGVA